MMCCATHEFKVCSPEPGTGKPFDHNNINFGAVEIVVQPCSSFLFHVFLQSSSSSQPQHIFICNVTDPQQLLYLFTCQVHRHYSVSGIIVYFHVVYVLVML
jgi:hypothetical protein